MKRTKEEKEKLKQDIQSLQLEKINYKDICKGLKISVPTYYRISSQLAKENYKIFFKEREKIIAEFFESKNNLIREARKKYREKDDYRIIYLVNQIENDTFDRLQSIGMIPREAEKIELGLGERLLNAIKKARELRRINGNNS
ncbi:MAG: hypothetical protein AB1467_06720 [Candidatus Diapherotrites archaeon]